MILCIQETEDPSASDEDSGHSDSGGSVGNIVGVMSCEWILSYTSLYAINNIIEHSTYHQELAQCVK